ncbi:nuclear transport factor 2 family protein [Sphingomonas sp. 1P06PA]|uniref:nuclear transport factor 2 family protein n=1 Tax=Sphingomonas sp. 1P06PA TaxID=554121 RepID=UPI0039A66C1F
MNEDIARIVYGYAEAVDEGRFEALGTLFVDGSFRVFDKGGALAAEATGREAVAGFFDGAVIRYDGVSRVRHIATNLITDIDGNMATARCTFLVVQALDDFPLQPITAGRYHWQFARREEGWAVKSLEIRIEFTGDNSRHARSA